jgi:hypothetical protein
MVHEGMEMIYVDLRSSYLGNGVKQIDLYLNILWDHFF